MERNQPKKRGLTQNVWQKSQRWRAKWQSKSFTFRGIERHKRVMKIIEKRERRCDNLISFPCSHSLCLCHPSKCIYQPGQIAKFHFRCGAPKLKPILRLKMCTIYEHKLAPKFFLSYEHSYTFATVLVPPFIFYISTTAISQSLFLLSINGFFREVLSNDCVSAH